MKRLLAALLLCLWAALASAAPAADAANGLVPLPALKSRVTDLTSTLAVEQIQQLESRLAEFEAKKGSQIAVLLLPTTQPEVIEQFGIRLAEAWKLGRKGVDDGVIVIVAKDDRALRIEVGYGLEGALNDATAKRIISEIMVPALKQGNYFGALQTGVAAVIGVIEGEPLPAAQGETGTGNGLPGGISENVFLVGLAAVAIGGAIVRFFLGNLLGSALVGGITGVAGWWLIGSVIGAAIGGIGGFLLAMFGFDLLLSILLNSGNSRGGRGGGGGSWSGGGGGFGGGGASGRW
jgi:uncharacterized protein